MAGTKAPTVGATDSLGVRPSDKVPFVSELVNVPERFPSTGATFYFSVRPFFGAPQRGRDRRPLKQD